MGLYRSALTTFFALLAGLAFVACSDEEQETTNQEDPDPHFSDRCPDGECVPCEGDGECPTGTYCGQDEGHQVCVSQHCVPGEAHCDEGQVVRCDDRGAGYLAPQECADGTCVDGECGCAGPEHCAPGEACQSGACVCDSGLYCGDEGVCCEEGDSCEDGQCVPPCPGSICGFESELCCEGETPACGPTGQCAPDCSDQGQLCGEDFDECCPSGDLCVFGECRTPGAECERFTDCDFGEYCDQGLGRCMPDDFPDDLECRQPTDFQEMEFVEKWSWTEENITAIPLVGDVTGDGETNVVVGTFDNNIVILDNQGNEIRRVEHDPDNGTWGFHWRSNAALADLTGDGVLDIIYPSRFIPGTEDGCCTGDTYIVAVNGQGETLWRAHDEQGDPVQVTMNTGAIGATNLDGDPTRAQIMVGGMLIDHDGKVVWNEDGQGPTYGAQGNYLGGLTIAADLTGDGKRELVTGRHAWTVDWQPAEEEGGWPQVTVELLWENTDGADGYPAVADISGNGKPEVVLFAGRTLRILEGDTGRLWCGIDRTGQQCEDDDSLRTQPLASPDGAGGRGGAPTVADFTGNGRPEVGVAGNNSYTVFGFFRPGFGDDDTPEGFDLDQLAEYGQDEPTPGEIFIHWYRATQDGSQATGSSVFDFQGDGVASVVYNDECYLRVYSGPTGETELRIQNSTGTRIEYPIVVDVDANGRSEIVVVANDQNRDCDDWDPDDEYEMRRGVFVYEDPNDLWVRTRSIWNQHAYSIDNISDDNTIPNEPTRWWESHNTFRANRQGEVPLNAADVAVVSVQVNSLLCPPHIDFQIALENQGVAAIPSGMPVTIYNADSGSPIVTLELEEAIAPGGIATVTHRQDIPEQLYNTPLNYQVVANDDGTGDDFVFDCNPDKATVLLETLECRIEN